MKNILTSLRVGRGAALMAGLALFSQTGFAMESKFDLYSWPKENNAWCFTLMPASKDIADAATVKTAKDQVCGTRHDAKRLLGMVLPEGAKVYWKVNEAEGLVLPPQEAVNDLKRFSTTMAYTIILPKGNPQNAKGDGWK